MHRFFALAGFLATAFACSLAAHGQVIFNDNFNGSNVATNDGAGAVNPTSNTNVFSGSASQSGSGAFYNPDPNGFYANQTEVSTTGNVNSNSAFGLTPDGLNFQVTAANVSVTRDGGARGDIPGSGNAGFRFELGIVSANLGEGDPELFNSNSGGVYVNLFYDAEGNLTGDLRITNKTKAGNNDASGETGLFDVAHFTLANSAAPVTVDFDLTSTGYSVSFNQAVTGLVGSLSGTYASVGITDEFDNGVRASLFGQEWNGGAGTGNITNFNVSAAAPEPSVVYLMGLGFLALAIFGVRRAGLLS